MEDRTILATVGIVSIAALECAALLTGNDGVYLLPVVAAISAIVSLLIGQKVGVNQCMKVLDELPEGVRDKVLSGLPEALGKYAQNLGLKKGK